MKTKQIYVYWYHLDTHTCPETEGYVGITNWPSRRHYQHSIGNGKGSKHLHNAFKKYGDRVQKTFLLVTDDREHAEIEEMYYRPVPEIGWNICAGGGKAPDCTGRIHPQKVREKISKTNRRTKASRPSIPSKFKGQTNRWSEDQKAAIGKVHKGKTISEAHRNAMTEKNSGAANVRSREIHLVHKDAPATVRKYVSLTQAAKELGVGYSGLRSLYQRSQKDQESKGPSRDGYVMLYIDDLNNPEQTVKKRLEIQAQSKRDAVALRESRRVRKS
jgi:hypothetical protein